MRNTDVYLRERGIKPSYQRKRIFEYLMDNRNHPTANEVYTALISDIPILSKATVYNTMKLFIEKNLVEVIPIEGHESRYDITGQARHAHFKCISCGKVHDVMLEIPMDELRKELSDSEILGLNVNITGLCADCIKRKS